MRIRNYIIWPIKLAKKVIKHIVLNGMKIVLINPFLKKYILMILRMNPTLKGTF